MEDECLCKNSEKSTRKTRPARGARWTGAPLSRSSEMAANIEEKWDEENNCAYYLDSATGASAWSREELEAAAQGGEGGDGEGGASNVETAKEAAKRAKTEAKAAARKAREGAKAVWDSVAAADQPRVVLLSLTCLFSFVGFCVLSAAPRGVGPSPLPSALPTHQETMGKIGRSGFSRMPSLLQVRNTRSTSVSPIPSPGAMGPADSAATSACNSGNPSCNPNHSGFSDVDVDSGPVLPCRHVVVAQS